MARKVITGCKEKKSRRTSNGMIVASIVDNDWRFKVFSLIIMTEVERRCGTRIINYGKMEKYSSTHEKRR